MNQRDERFLFGIAASLVLVCLTSTACRKVAAIPAPPDRVSVTLSATRLYQNDECSVSYVHLNDNSDIYVVQTRHAGARCTLNIGPKADV